MLSNALDSEAVMIKPDFPRKMGGSCWGRASESGLHVHRLQCYSDYPPPGQESESQL